MIETQRWRIEAPFATTMETGGYDSCIIVAPARWWRDDGTLDSETAGLEMANEALAQAVRMGELIHHAEFVMTDNPDEVTTLGLLHDCPTCRAGVDQALAHLREHPDRPLVIGQLWWVQPADEP